MISFPNVFDM